jgi:Zn-dependent protease with chaperone function
LLGLAPWRGDAWFVERWSLFAGSHWNQIRLGGVGAAHAASAALCVVGIVLYLRDAVPFMADRVVRTAAVHPLPHDHPAGVRARKALEALPAPGREPRPAVTVLDHPSPVLLCTGVGRTEIVISTGALDRLDDPAFEAALAHELAHLARRDPLVGWWLMAARTLQCFNPVVQIVARQAVQDIERRADIAVTAQGRSEGLADAVRRLSLADEVHSDLALPSESGYFADRVLASAHRRALDTRCQLLLEGDVPDVHPFRGWRTGLAVTAVGVLLFFVV